MILTRLGNKRAIAHKIIPYFPPHKFYIEPFFGAGGMFFSKPKALYNSVNDLDSDVFNLFQVVMDRREEFEEMLRIMPIHQDLLKHWMQNRETDPIRKAVRFIFLSNFTYLGAGKSLKNEVSDPKKLIYERLNLVQGLLKDVKFMNLKAVPFLKSISLSNPEKETSFIYADPPYLGTDNNYQSGFKEEDTRDLFKCLVETGIKFAVSEFNNEVICDLVDEYQLNKVVIGERQNMKNRRTEILVMNYRNQPTLF